MPPSIYKQFIPFYSATYTRQYLTAHYQKYNVPQPTAKGYEVAYSFMYHLQHGELYFEQAKIAPITLKPVLLYYGLIQLIKGCVLTKDPSYPENSQVLAHGVSTRKRKKSAYHFLDDEVKTQKNGLLSHFLDKMFHMKHLAGEKYKMHTLFHHLADMHPLFFKIYGKSISFQGRLQHDMLLFPTDVLDHYHMTPNRFEQYLETFTHSGYDKSKRIYEKEQHISIPLLRSATLGAPWLFNDKGIPYLLKNRELTEACPLPELAVHYLLLYNLSMISRYETEWWGELTHTFDGADFPFIIHYLSIAEEKIPPLIATFLHRSS